jgi:hypothetical protein
MKPQAIDITPGVRRLVTWLNREGFETTDSGDGVANVEAGIEGALNYPHVAIEVCPPYLLVGEANRLRNVLRMAGVKVHETGRGDHPWIQASYDPVTKVAVMFLANVEDSMLPEGLGC